METLLQLSRKIDALNVLVGRVVAWLILIMVVISTANAFGRKFFHTSSNAWLEIQWYMFGALFLLSAGYALLRNDHVRVDIIAQRFSQRTQIYIEIFGVLFFLLPGCGIIMWLAWPMFWESFISNEMSSNSGGLIRWPAKLLVPVGFTLLIAAALSHLVKCIGFLRNQCPDPRQREATTDERALADDIAARLKEEACATDGTATSTDIGRPATRADQKGE